MTWIVKVGDQYLAKRDCGWAECSKKQKDAIRYKSQGSAWRACRDTFGLWDGYDEDDREMCGRVVKLKVKK